ncbi:HET-domain-containing protein [Venturia nashicola]|nr:HET-domain-containing protein [Venturia nashicola]
MSTWSRCIYCGQQFGSPPWIPGTNFPDDMYSEMFFGGSPGNGPECSFCNVLRDGIRMFEDMFPDSSRIHSVDAGYRVADRGFVTVLNFSFGSPLGLEFIGNHHEEGLILEFPSTKDSIHESVRWVQEQMHVCDKEHTRCSIHQPGHGKLPTRVVDVNTIRLATPDTGTVGRYACLSHCWGKSQPLKTLRNNMADFQSNIPWGALPETFKDAIGFVRNLGIPYLWIDSLCIVQDDGEDWAREAANMASIYQNSTVTLAGTKSNSSEQGLFSHDPLPTNARRLEVTGSEGDTHYLYVRLRRPHWDDKIGNDYSHTQLQLYPLLTRAWCYQERLLSPRFVHFCSTELVWECMEHSRCQCGLFQPWFELKLSGTTSFGLPQAVTAHSTEYHSWKEIVQKYSQLAITYDSDRLTALLGLANDARKYHKGRYLAGMWEDTLVEDMLWYVSNDPTGERPRLHSPPTWSWAATSAPISFKDVTDHMCQIIDVNCTSTTGSVHGKHVPQGSLTICGHLVQSTVEYENTDKERIKVLGTYIRPDYEFWSTASHGTHVLNGEKVFCLTIGRDHRDWGCLLMLVLVRTNSSLRLFQRIGMFWIQAPDNLICYPEWDSIWPIEIREHEERLLPPTTEKRHSYWIQFIYSNEYGGNIEAADNFLSSTSITRSSFTKLSKEQLMANITEKEANEIRADEFVKQVIKAPETHPIRPGQKEWFITAQDEERKVKGERYFKYLGETITIL